MHMLTTDVFSFIIMSWKQHFWDPIHLQLCHAKSEKNTHSVIQCDYMLKQWLIILRDILTRILNKINKHKMYAALFRSYWKICANSSKYDGGEMVIQEINKSSTYLSLKNSFPHFPGFYLEIWIWSKKVEWQENWVSGAVSQYSPEKHM